MAEDETLELVWLVRPGVTSCERVSRPGGLCGVGPPLGLQGPALSSETHFSQNTSRTPVRSIHGPHAMHMRRSQALSTAARHHTLSQVHS